MLQKMLLIIFFALFILSGVGCVRFLRSKGLFISRWIFGLSSFLVVILPLTFVENLSTVVTYSLYVLSGLFAVMFFETTRLKLENNEYKGIVRSEQFSQKTDEKKHK